MSEQMLRIEFVTAMGLGEASWKEEVPAHRLGDQLVPHPDSMGRAIERRVGTMGVKDPKVVFDGRSFGRGKVIDGARKEIGRWQIA